jgi:ubiquinone/menaquinone biosynthesis C-methylase UbiE
VTFDPVVIRHAYEAIAGDYAEKFGDELEVNDFDRAIVDAAIAAVPPGEIVLDIGCGPAQVSTRAVAAGASAVGVDLTPAMLTTARRRAPRLPLTCGNVLALPYRDGAAAAAIAWYSLHHLPRSVLPRAVVELRRVLRTGGIVVIATHAGQGELAIEQQWEGRTETVIITYHEGEELAALVTASGFLSVEIRERPPLEHEHQARKLYLTATAAPM